MANPGGGNQFGSYQLQPGYGDVGRQTRLTRQAPISGAPFATHALEAPRRDRKQATRPGRQPQVAPQTQPQPPQPQPSGQATQAMVWQMIARIPGASPLVQQLAAQANS